MYKYSPIRGIRIKNFRNIGDAQIDFDDSPIISLVGENEAGKTSVVKAFSVCAVHSTPRDQKDYIRDGTTGFGVEIQLQDGTEVTRIKTATLNRYHIKYPDGKEWDATKIEGGIPPQVQDVMGLIEEPETKEYLQIRTYEDPLLFVVTPASTNYKVMYGALKVEQLTRGIKAGSKEANAIKAEIDSNETGISTLTSNLRSIRTADITPLINIRQRLTNELSELSKLERAISMVNKLEQCNNELGILKLLTDSGITPIDETESMRLSSIGNIVDRINELISYSRIISNVNTLEILDTKELDKIESVIDRVNELSRLEDKSSYMKDISGCEMVSVEELIALTRCMALENEIESKSRQLEVIDISQAAPIEQAEFNCVTKIGQVMAMLDRNKQLESSNSQIIDYINQVNNYMKAIGAIVETCPKCGETIVIDAEKYV